MGRNKLAQSHVRRQLTLRVGVFNICEECGLGERLIWVWALFRMNGPSVRIWHDHFPTRSFRTGLHSESKLRPKLWVYCLALFMGRIHIGFHSKARIHSPSFTIFSCWVTTRIRACIYKSGRACGNPEHCAIGDCLLPHYRAVNDKSLSTKSRMCNAILLVDCSRAHITHIMNVCLC